jgi:hypothetical protein
MVAIDGRRWLSVDRLGEKPTAVLRSAAKQTVAASGLYTEPYRGDLGDLGTLSRAISDGIQVIPPAVVHVPGKGLTVLGGERRVAARRQLGQQDITVYVVKTWREFVAWMLLDEEQARKNGLLFGRIDWPMGLVDAAWWTRKVLDYLKTSPRSDFADQTMAEHIGRSHDRIRDVRYQLRWLDHEDEAVRAYATAQLAEVQRGATSGSTIGGRIAKFMESRTRMPVKQQRDTLLAASSQCAGLADALRPVAAALTDELTDEEITTYLRHLTEGRLQTERVIRALKAIQRERSA